jgi:hypothetical protein
MSELFKTDVAVMFLISVIIVALAAAGYFFG